MRKYLYLPIESKVRELDAKLLLAIEAAYRGYVVVIGSKKIMTYLEKLPAGAFFYKDTSTPMASVFRKIKNSGHKIIVHDEEGFVQQSWQRYRDMRVPLESIKFVDLFLCWGSQQYDVVSAYASKHGSMTQVEKVGHPRTDLLRHPLRDYNNVKKYDAKPTILINTKLAEWNHWKGRDGWLDILNSHNMIRNDNELQRRLDQREFKKKLFAQYEKLVRFLSASNPNSRIILRPHPSESVDNWKLIAENLPNVTVTNQKAIGFWIHNADVVIHTSCTTAIEAFLMDKATISYKPISDPRFEEKLPDEISFTATAVEDCLDLVQAVISKRIDFVTYKARGLSVLSSNLHALNGKFSYELIMTQLDKMKLPSHKFNVVSAVRLRIFFFLKEFFSVFKRFILYILRCLKLSSSIEKSVLENQTFRSKEIKKTVDDLGDYLPHAKKIVVSQVGKNMFMLRKR